MKKRFLNLLLVMLMVVCVLPMAASADAVCKHNRTSSSTVKLVEAKDATCAEEGYEAYYQCTVCKKVFKPKGSSGWDKAAKTVIPATGKHNYTVNEGYRTGDEATCTETGIFVLKCADCDARTAQVAPVDESNHDYVSGVCTRCGDCKNDHVSNKIVTSAKPATCTEDGAKKNVYQCKVCGIFFCNGEYKTTNDFPENVIRATGTHDFSVWKANVTPATCTKREVERYQCATCTATEDREVGNLLSSDGTHTPGAMIRYITRPTCQATGEAEYECKVCGETVVQVIRKLNCNIVDVQEKAPTCNNTGLTAGKTCTICDDTSKNQSCAYCAEIKVEQKVVDKLGHDHVLDKEHADYKAATCTETGVDVFDCTRCGYDNVHVTTPALGCNEIETVIKEATCTKDGVKFVECDRCGVYILAVITAPGHTEEIVPAVPATCTATGLTEGKKCAACNEILLAQTVTPITDHEFTVTVPGKPATCTEDGYTEHKKCAHCDATQGKEEIDTDGHVFVKYICTVCGQRDGSCEHKNRVMKYTAPTCTDAGSQSFWCPDCNYESMEILDKIAHSYSGGKCSGCGAIDPDSICNHTNGYTTDTEGATCTQSGSIITRCGDCGAVVDRVTLPATGHNHVNGICTACGHKDNNRFTYDFQDVHVVGGTSY